MGFLVLLVFSQHIITKKKREQIQMSIHKFWPILTWRILRATFISFDQMNTLECKNRSYWPKWCKPCSDHEYLNGNNSNFARTILLQSTLQSYMLVIMSQGWLLITNGLKEMIKRGEKLNFLTSIPPWSVSLIPLSYCSRHSNSPFTWTYQRKLSFRHLFLSYWSHIKGKSSNDLKGFS